MMTTKLPKDVQQQMAPGDRFPGHAETLATPVGSDKPVQVKIGQRDNRHLQLSKEEFRARSAKQREIDENAKATAACKPVPRPKNEAVENKESRPKPAAPQSNLTGPHCQVPSTIKALAQGVYDIGATPALEERMSRLERGIDMIVRALWPPSNAERDARHRSPLSNAPLEEVKVDKACTEPLCGISPDSSSSDVEEDDFPESPTEVELGESYDKPIPAPSQVEELGDHSHSPVPDADKGLLALQQAIAKSNPQKFFRQYWHQLARTAQFNEWSAERQDAFGQLFDSIVVHPKFIHQVSKFLRGARNGRCIGDKQITRVCSMVAGFLTVYNLAAAEK